MLRKLLRGSSSQGSQEKQAKEKEKAKYNLPRLAKVRPCEWPCDDFLKEAGIHEDFYSLIENASLTGFLHDRIDSISYSPILLCKIFIIILRSHRLQYHFIYMMNSEECLYVIFARYVGYPMREN